MGSVKREVVVGLGKEGFLALGSFAPRRVACLVSLSTRLGTGGGTNRLRRCCENGGVTLVFRGADAEAHYSFRMTTRSLKVNDACLSPANSRVNGGRDVTSATEILKEVCSNVRCHKFNRRIMRRLTGRTNIPM